MDASINNVIMTINKKVKKDISQDVDYFNKIILQNQMTFGDSKICLNDLTTQVDNIDIIIRGHLLCLRIPEDSLTQLGTDILTCIGYPELDNLLCIRYPYMVLQRGRLVQQFYKLV